MAKSKSPFTGLAATVKLSPRIKGLRTPGRTPISSPDPSSPFKGMGLTFGQRSQVKRAALKQAGYKGSSRSSSRK